MQSHDHTNFFIPKKQASTTLLAIAASPIAKGSATAEPTADADAFFGRSFYQPQQQWGLTSYSNNWNQQYNPQQMWGTQSGYLNNHYGKRSADAEPTADAEAGYYGGYYGHHAYGYGYPHYGYGYRAYGYGYPYAYHYGK